MVHTLPLNNESLADFPIMYEELANSMEFWMILENQQRNLPSLTASYFDYGNTVGEYSNGVYKK